MAEQRSKKRLKLETGALSAKIVDSNSGNDDSATTMTMNPYTGAPYSARYHRLRETRTKLPVHAFREELRRAVASHQVVVVEGETGSGKTTQIPQFLVEEHTADGGVVACTQPRRVAATSVAARVAEEMDVALGTQVGYTVRFEDMSDPDTTLLKFVTDGMLLREAMGDPMLSRYSVVMLDEAHERTLATDVLMGLLQNLLEKRSSPKSPHGGMLRMVVMSATLDAEKFQNYFRGAPLLKVPGRTFPVDVFYTAKPERNYVEAAVRTALQIHQHEGPGDVLVFLTGEQEIETACREIREGAPNGEALPELVVYPLYSSLPPSQQAKIFDPAPAPRVLGGPRGRKIVVSTNVAETSLTIDGVVYVVDPGFSKQKVYNPRIRVESLLVSPISRASARQRAGRAGRTRPGKCFRLYTEKSFHRDLRETTYPEILRSKMSSVVLTLKKLGVDDLVHFDFMDPPAPETLMRALETLNYLGALDDEGDMTDFGRLMSDMPVDPQLAKTIVNASSPEFHCSDEILTIVACLSVPQIFSRPRESAKEADVAKALFAHADGDHQTLLNAYDRYQSTPPDERRKWAWDHFLNERSLESAASVRRQLEGISRKLDLPLLGAAGAGDPNAVRRTLTSGNFMQTAYKQRNGQYLTVKDNQIVHVHPSSVLTDVKPDWVVFEEFALTTKNYVRTVTSTRVDWLVNLAPHYFDLENFPECEAKAELELAYRRSAHRGGGGSR